MGTAPGAGEPRDHHCDRCCRMVIERAKVDLANLPAAGTHERQSRRASSQDGFEGRIEARPGSTCRASIPQLDQLLGFLSLDAPLVPTPLLFGATCGSSLAIHAPLVERHDKLRREAGI